MTTVKITELSDIGANLASSTVVPVVNMAGTPITQKTNVGNIANLILEGAGVDYSEASVALLAQTVSNAAQPNITSVGTLTNVVVSGNATVNGNITSNGTAYVGNLSTTGLASITTLDVGTTANLGSIANVIITGGTIGQILSTDGEGNLSWTSDATTYGNSNVVTLLSAFGSNTITTTGNVSVGNITATNLGNIATLNLDGNASNVLRGDGTFGADANSSYSDSNVVSLLSAFGSNTIVTTGIITADGANLSNVPYANLTGAPSLGNISNINLDGNVSNLLTGNGTYVAIPVVPTVGNIATLNLDGSNSNVLYGNGVFAAVTGGANTGNVTFSGNVISTTSTNDLLISLDNKDLIANTSNGGAMGFYSGNSSLVLNNDTPGVELTGLNVNIVAVAEGDIFLDATAANGVVQISSEANTTITANGNDWTFDNDGNLTLPGNTFAVNYANGTQVSLGGGGGAAISNGTSNVSVVAANGNVVIGVNNDSANWTFATDGNIYAKPETDLILVVADPNGDGYAVKQSVTDGTTELSRTSLEDGQFSIYTNLDGAGEEWRFNGNTLQVSTNSTVRGFDSNVVVQAMFAGTSGKASLQSVSNSNDPNIFTTIDATTTGANISVYNGGSNSGVGYTWQFANDGRLTFPGTPRIDTDANNFEVQAAEAISLEANTVVNIYTDAGNTTYQWQFGDDGNLTLPTGGQIIVSGGLVSSGASPAPTINGFSITNSVGISGNGNIAGNNISATGNVTAQGVGTNLVRRANTISGSNTAVTLDNLNAYVGGTPIRLYIGAATSNMTMAGQSQTMSTGALAVSSWINVPIVTGTGNGFAMSGAITNDGDTAVLNVTDQGGGSGTWRVTGMIANTSANLYSVSIERLA